MKFFITLIISLSLFSFAYAAKSDDSDTSQNHGLVDGKTAVITGTIRLVGSLPFTSIVLTPSSGYDIYMEISNDEKVKLKKSIGKRASVSGKISIKNMSSADGKYSHKRFIIQPDKIELLEK